MADHVPHWTPRLKLTYTVAGFEHEMTVRGIRGIPFVPDDHIDKLEAVLTAFSARLYDDFQGLGYSWADEDSVFFSDLDRVPDIAGLSSSTGRSVTQRTVQVRFESRSFLGGRGALVIFGSDYNLVSDTEFIDFRKSSAEDSAVAGTITVLREAPFWACGDGLAANWKNYANVKMNDAAVEKARRG